MAYNWEEEIADLLRRLSDVQRELLAVLSEKRSRLAEADLAGIERLHAREQAVCDQLQACQAQRARLLEQAAIVGLPNDSLKSLVSALPQRGGLQFQRDIQDAARRASFLQHQSLTNWMLTQRTLLHLSQLIEIIATGGRLQPTYGMGESARGSGSLVDQAA